MKTISINAGKELLQRSVLPRLRPVADHEEGRLTARFLDLEVEYYIPLASGGLKSLNMVLPDDILDGTDITMETLHEWALTNLASFADRIGSVEEELRKADYPVMDDPDAPHMALLKLKNDMLDGAAVMMLKEKLHRVMLDFQGDFYIIPSSKHEVLCVRADGDEAEQRYLKNMIRIINRTELRPEDILSDNLYLYRAATKTIEIVGGDPNDSNSRYSFG